MVAVYREEVVSRHQRRQRSQHLAPVAARTEVKQRAGQGREIEPARMRHDPAQDGNNQQQVSSHGHLELIDFPRKLLRGAKEALYPFSAARVMRSTHESFAL